MSDGMESVTVGARTAADRPTAWRSGSRAGWRAAGLVAVVAGLGLALSACGGGSPAASPPAKVPVDATLTKAIHALDSGDKATAVADFLLIVREDPKNQIAWYDLGYIAQENDQDSQAIHDYQSSLAGDPNYVPALYNLAILDTPSAPQTAATLYERAIKVEPDDADAHLNYGFLLETLGQEKASQEQLFRAVQLDPTLKSRIPASASG
jgi:Tfp pilus assembly protein PilF